MPRVMLLSDATGAPNCAGVSAPSIAARIEDGCPCDRGTSAARQFGEEIPDHDGRIQVLAFERHGGPAVLHRIQNDHGGTVFHPGHAVDRGTPAFMRQRRNRRRRPPPPTPFPPFSAPFLSR